MTEPERTRRVPVGRWLGVSVALGALLLLALAPSTVAAPSPPTTNPTKCVTGSEPEFPGYDPVTHEVYVPNALSSNITVLSGTCTYAGSISLPAGAFPVMAAFDPQNNHMYVTDNLLNQVYDISGTKIVATITGFDSPWGLAWDPGDSVMLVGNLFSNNVTGVRAGSILLNLSVGSGPGFIGYDPYWGVVLTSNFDSDNVTVLNAVTLSHVSDFGVGIHPGQIAFDPVTDLDYVTNQYGNNLTIFSGAGFTVSNVGGFKSPDGDAWDQATLQMWVGNYDGDRAFVMNGTHIVARDLLTSGAKGLGVVYDEYNDDMYVSDAKTNAVYIFS